MSRFSNWLTHHWHETPELVVSLGIGFGAPIVVLATYLFAENFTPEEVPPHSFVAQLCAIYQPSSFVTESLLGKPFKDQIILGHSVRDIVTGNNGLPSHFIDPNNYYFNSPLYKFRQHVKNHLNENFVSPSSTESDPSP